MQLVPGFLSICNKQDFVGKTLKSGGSPVCAGSHGSMDRKKDSRNSSWLATAGGDYMGVTNTEVSQGSWAWGRGVRHPANGDLQGWRNSQQKRGELVWGVRGGSTCLWGRQERRRFAVAGWGVQTWGERARTCSLGEGKEKGMGMWWEEWGAQSKVPEVTSGQSVSFPPCSAGTGMEAQTQMVLLSAHPFRSATEIFSSLPLPLFWLLEMW